jgi:hypothetical protein
MLPDDILNLVLDQMSNHLTLWERMGMPGYSTAPFGLLKAQRRAVFSSFTLTCHAWANIGQPRLFKTIYIADPNKMRLLYCFVSRKPLLVSCTTKLILGPFLSNIRPEDASALTSCSINILHTWEFTQIRGYLISLESLRMQNLPSIEDAHIRLRQGLLPLSHQIRQLQLVDSSMHVDSLLALVDMLPELNNLGLTTCRLFKGPHNPHFGLPGPPRSKIRILTQSVSLGESDAQWLSVVNLTSLILASHIEVLNLMHLPELSMASPFIKHAASTMTSLTIIFAFRLYAGTTLVSPEPPLPIPRLRYLHLGGVSRETLDWTTHAITVFAKSCQPGTLHMKLEVQCESDDKYALELEAFRKIDRSAPSFQSVEMMVYGIHLYYETMEAELRVMMPECQRRGILDVTIEMSSYQ